MKLPLLVLLSIFRPCHGFSPDVKFSRHVLMGESAGLKELVNDEKAHAYRTEYAENINEMGNTRGDMKSREKRTAVMNKVLFPKNQTIHYGYGDEYGVYTDEEKVWIRNQMSAISENSCLEIKEKDSGHREVMFWKGKGCRSGVGYKGPTAIHWISIPGYWCYHAVQHELFHTLGFGHTLGRHDRDKYIKTVRFRDPNEYTPEEELPPVVPYDYKSIMHTPSYYGYVDGEPVDGLPVVVPFDVDYAPTMGSSIAPAFSDYKALNLRYKCGDQCPQIKCENGGYQHPKTCGKCVCHDFAVGDRCEKLTILKLTERPDHVEEVAMDETKVLSNISFNPKYDKVLPIAFMAPEGKKLLVKIQELGLAFGNMTSLCQERCDTAAFEFIDREDGDLTMGGKLFCCGNRQGYSFVTKSNILGFTGHVWKGRKASIVFTVEVADKQSNSTHWGPDPVWKLPNGEIVE